MGKLEDLLKEAGYADFEKFIKSHVTITVMESGLIKYKFNTDISKIISDFLKAKLRLAEEFIVNEELIQLCMQKLSVFGSAFDRRRIMNIFGNIAYNIFGKRKIPKTYLVKQYEQQYKKCVESNAFNDDQVDIINIGVFILTMVRWMAKQEKIISRCKIANILDFGDLSYIRKYNNALSNYIDIMDIQKTVYNRDDIEKRIELVSIIYDNLILEKKVEKSNKYVFEDNIYGIYKNVDVLVQANYLGDEATGYERYLNEIVLNLEELKDKHSFNDYAIETYNEALDNIYNKFIDINTMLNNSSLSIMLDNIKEMAI